MRRRSIFLKTSIILLFSSFTLAFFVGVVSSSEPPYRVIEGSIKGGETFSQSLAKNKILPKWIHLTVSELTPFMDFRRIKRGETYQFITNDKGEMVRFIYEVSPTEAYEIEKDSRGEYVAKKKEIPLEIRLTKVEGEIRSSLAGAIKAAGEKSSLVNTFTEILAWEIDFDRDVREGDQFKLLVEKIFKADQFIKYGMVHAIEYQSGKKVIGGVRFKNKFYNEKGNSFEKAFLKTPLRFDYISSGFNRKRRHPIMGGLHPHLAIDYAAPAGTPVWAVADGVVGSYGWVEGFGKQILIRHPNGYVSYYSHLARYWAGIKRGKRVEQKQIIGYVGSTGFSTGPHLDYRLSKNGQFINPLKETFPSGTPIEPKDREAFRNKKDEMLSWLASDVPKE